jgi:bifunctional UDP-N-acetylglucosamine pyrophosphorylase / glucosamine-1-phosphate N-acetyltransferase
MGMDIATVVMAAGRGSRMKGYDGNKTLLPLVPGAAPFEGERPILRHILASTPAGPKAIVVHFRRKDVEAATADLNATYCEQPELNGTGGAVLAVRDFLAEQTAEAVLVTMGDVPFVKPETYGRLLAALETHPLVVLGFQPADRKQYGVLEIDGDRVTRITEHKYWREYPPERQAALSVCNAGIYAARRRVLLDYLPILESRPQIVRKERDGRMTEIREYFLTDIAEYMTDDGLSVGFALVEEEMETLGVDDPEALARAQRHYRSLTD